jgi:hypothetical protein
MAQINKPNQYFNTKLYSGNSTDDTAITGVGFQPDWLWIKERTNTSGHQLQDVIRGATKQLFSNDNQAEATNTTKVKSFDSDGFTLGTSGSVNVSGDTYVAWNWLASNTTASNSDGSITSTVSVNATSGFSIVSYTGNGSAGATVGHGLGSTPKMVIVKRRNTAAQWNVYHESLGNTGALYLNDTIAFNVVAGFWNNTSPNSTTFTLGTDAAGNGSGDTYIAYCFAEKQGFSKFGSYVGNGSADGTFVYTGFKPAFVMIKRTDAAGHYWHIYDNKRSSSGGSNIMDDVLYPNENFAEYSGDKLDIISNGIKFRSGNTDINASGGTYIYMVFAENPLVGTNNIPATAR